MKKVIGITGAAGTIGRTLEQGLEGCYKLRLYDILPPRKNELFPYYYQIDLAKKGNLSGIFDGIDVLVHLAADIQPTSPWKSIKRNNIDMTFSVFAEAAKAGVKKIVFASTNHTQNGDLMVNSRGYETLNTAFYNQGRLLTVRDPPNPDSMYAVSKLFGENLGKLYSRIIPMQFIALRIGWIIPENDPRTKSGTSAEDHIRAMFLSKRDCVEVFRRAIEANVKHFIGYAISNNDRKVFDIRETEETLGYRPRDNAENYFQSGA